MIPFAHQSVARGRMTMLEVWDRQDADWRNRGRRLRTARLRNRHNRRAIRRRWVLEAEGPNLAYCGWYLRQLGIPGYETCTCSFGCWEEPACMELGAPHPDARYIALGELDYQPVTLRRSTT